MRAPPLLTSLALVLALANMAAAQLPPLPVGCSVGAALDRPTSEHDPGETQVFNLTVTNSGQVDGTATIDLSETSGGWAARVVPASAPVAAGADASFRIEVTAPPEGGVRTQGMTAQANLDCGGVAQASSAPQEFTASLRGESAGPGGPGPSLQGVGSPVLLLLAIVVLAAALILLALRSQRGIALTSESPRRDVEPGGGASFPVAVANLGRERAEVALRVASIPEGWRLIAPPDKVDLAPKERRTVQFLVRSPAKAQPRDLAEIVVEAQPAGDAKPAKLTLRAFVVEKGSIAASERPDVVVRDEERLA